MHGLQDHQERGARARGGDRADLYLPALLRWDADKSVVRIRNLSPRGAMIEGSALPDCGRQVRLIRGRLDATGRTAWIHGGRCGLKLDAPLDIQAWLAAPANQDQTQVDRLIGALRSGDMPAIWPHERLGGDAYSDLGLANRLLGQVAERLAEDAAVLAHQSEALQQLDLIAKLLGLMRDAGSDSERAADLRRLVSSALKRSEA